MSKNDRGILAMITRNYVAHLVLTVAAIMGFRAAITAAQAGGITAKIDISNQLMDV